jgi:DNA invertase Pin-like site-specific DNA recombinase
MKKVAELIRVSTEAQAGDDRASIPAQRAINRRTAAQFGLKIVESIEMADVSGTAVLATPEIQRLLLRLESKEIDGVVCREFSRLMRPERFADYVLLAAFQDNRKVLYLPDGPVDFGTKQGMLLGGLRALMAGHERSEMLERAWGAKEAMRRQGKFPNAEICLPHGVLYDRTTGRWSYDPEKAPRVIEVFRRFLGGDTNYNALSEVLGTSRGTAKNILTNPIYSGYFVVDEKRDLTHEGKRVGKAGRQSDRRKIRRADDEVIRVKVLDPPLIREADFRRVQQMVRTKARASLKERKKIGEFVYNGYLKCAKCGARLHTFRNQFDRFYYICSNKKRKNEAGENLCPDTRYMNRDELEAKLDVLLRTKLTSVPWLKGMAKEHDRQRRSDGHEAKAARLEDQLKALAARRERVVESFLDGAINKEARDARLAMVDADIAKAAAALGAVRPAPTFRPDELAEMFRPFRNWGDQLPADQKRMLLAAIAAEFLVADYKIVGLRMFGVKADILKDSRMRTAPSASHALPCL